MQKILLIDDDPDMLGLHRMRLADTYEIIETDKPEHALGLALQHKPSAILLDLMMPKFSGFELCQSFHALSYTSRIPVFVITGESAAKYQEHCESLGTKAFFEKPVDYKQLKARLASELSSLQVERRECVRVKMRVILKLLGTDASDIKVEVSTPTENISARGFLCASTVNFLKDAEVEVFLLGEQERYAGRARVVRRESPGAPWQRYGFHFADTTPEWILQGK
ncbi:MAG TPA: response regulator [Candidatus Saccharimonadales bacterium]|nr:response regulator [Candidatus Saccharimonadales bacterium]